MYPAANANAISLASLLKESGVSDKELQSTGAVVKLIFAYNCELHQTTCYPTLTFEKLSKEGDLPIEVEDTIPYISDIEMRDYLVLRGLRIIVEV